MSPLSPALFSSLRQSEIKATTLHARLDDDLHFESIYDTGDLLGKGRSVPVVRVEPHPPHRRLAISAARDAFATPPTHPRPPQHPPPLSPLAATALCSAAR